MTTRKLFIAALLLLTVPTFAAPHYKVTDMGPIQLEDTFAVNSHGQVVGSVSYAPIGEGIKSAWLWAHGRRTAIKPQEGFECVINCTINDRGEVAGSWATTTDGATLVYQKRAFLWRRGQSQDVFLGTEYQQTEAGGLSELGEVVGRADNSNHPDPENPQSAISHALRHTVIGHTIDLGPGAAEAVNSHGQVIGTDDLNNQVLWEGGVKRQLGVEGQAVAVSNWGQVLLNDRRAGLDYPLLWQKGTAHALPLPDAEAGCTASALNDAGEVVGTYRSDKHGVHALLWRGGYVYDLNTFLPPRSGWVLQTATGISSKGQIVGSGTLGGKPHAFLLTPR